ncbi:hypothetical protein [Haladaptatus sp. ZSTT2]|uniref:hypothetical protein n=1 Tax=Haladaptatus sp. ZSTT2 TaxID=3120515 RepID=UPI00300EA15B
MNVESVGAYIPRYRITAETIGDALGGFSARGVAEKRVLSGDEDTVTMAVEAARKALADSAHSRDDLTALAFATTTPPVDEGDVGVQVAEILGLSRDVEISVHTQSTRAGTRALLTGLRADGPALAVAADSPQAAPKNGLDHAAGAGAVAFVAAPGDVSVTDVASYAREYPGTRFRQRGASSSEAYNATGYERDAYTDAVSGAASNLESVADAVALTAPDGSLPSRGARTLSGDVTPYHAARTLGDLGAASALFSLLAAWNDGEDEVTVLSYGDGAGADALTFTGRLDGDWAREAVDISYAQYLRKRGYLDVEGEN